MQRKRPKTQCCDLNCWQTWRLPKKTQKSLESKLNWYTSNPTESDIVAADSELALAQAKYDAAKASLESLQIKSPINGIVFEVSAEGGQTYQGETTLFTIGDPKALEVVANVTEEDYPLISVGQSVEVYFDARPEVTVQGKIDRIIPDRIEGDRPLYNIYISLNEVPDGLADGMTSDTAITIAKREGVLCLPRAIVRASGEIRPQSKCGMVWQRRPKRSPLACAEIRMWRSFRA